MIGFNRTGLVGACSLDEGCLNPEPELLGVQIGALMIFKNVADSWEQHGDGMSGFRLGYFRMDLARQWAEGYGFEWDADLQDWVAYAVRWYKQEFNRRQKARQDAAEKYKQDFNRRQKARQDAAEKRKLTSA